MGGLTVILGNVGIFGWWLGTPGPVFTSQFTWTIAGLGSLLFVSWGLWSGWCWRRGRPLALTTFAAALLSLGPSLVLVQQTHPYLAYVAAAALSIALADLFPRRWLRQTWLLSMIILLATAVGLGNMTLRLEAVREDGQPSDPIVRSAILARRLAPIIQAQVSPDQNAPPLKLVLLQPPLLPDDIQQATRLGDRHVTPTTRHAALGGIFGACLLAGPGSEVVWTNSLLRVPPAARVLCETSQGFTPWGNTWEALLYATILDLTMGNFTHAGDELARAMELSNNLDLFIYDAERLQIPQTRMMQGAVAFQDWLSGQGAADLLSPDEVTLLRAGVRRLMTVAWQAP